MYEFVPHLFLAGKPHNLAVSAHDANSATLSFVSVPGARSYEYALSTTSAVAGFGAWAALASSKVITGLTGGTQYWIKVRIVNGVGRGPAAPAVTVTTDAGLSWTKKVGPAIQNIAFGANSATFSAQAINNSSTGDLILVKVSTNARAISGVTIGGDAMTKVVESGTGAAAVSIWKRTGNTYATPDIVVSAADALGYVGMSAGVLTNANTTETATGVKSYGYGADPQTASAVTIPNPGFALIVAASETGGNDPTWNVGTEDYDLQATTAWRHTSGFHGTAGSFTASISNWNFAGSGMAVAVFGI